MRPTDFHIISQEVRKDFNKLFLYISQPSNIEACLSHGAQVHL